MHKTTRTEPTTTVQGLALLRALEKLLIVCLELAVQVDDRQGSGSYYAILNRALHATREQVQRCQHAKECAILESDN